MKLLLLTSSILLLSSCGEQNIQEKYKTQEYVRSNVYRYDVEDSSCFIYVDDEHYSNSNSISCFANPTRNPIE